jgi:Bifunctional DNA primase/polymerase, N-terminal
VTPLGAVAVAYAGSGYEVFPLRGKLPWANCPQCEPRSPRYQPHRAHECEHELCHGLYAATSDPERVARWWVRWPKANIGARIPPSLLVVDVDPRHGGQARLAVLEREHGPLPPTRVSISGRGDGGRHYWFLHPGGRLSAARLGAGLDLKTHTGYVLLPPSRHPATGRPYRWADPIVDPAPMPDWLVFLLTPPAATAPVPARRRPQPPARPGESVAERFNAQVSWVEVLGPHGWTCPDPNPDADGARLRATPPPATPRAPPSATACCSSTRPPPPSSPPSRARPTATAASAPTPSWSTAATCAPPPAPSTPLEAGSR